MARNKNIKKAYVEQEFSPEQIQEMRRCKNDPVYFIETYVKIVHPKRGAVNFELYDYQRELIKSYHENRDSIVLSARQTGKCCFENTLICVINTSENSKKTLPIKELHDQLNPTSCEIYNDSSDELKFIEQTSPNNILVETPYGYSKVKHSHKTVKYDIWKIRTDSYELLCADEHIVINEKNQSVYIKDLKIGDVIQTRNGIEQVISIEKTSQEDNMYDLELDDDNHVYYTNGIVSHNSITTSAYILWFTCFKKNKEVLIASNKEKSAKEMVKRIRYAYEHLPMWLKPGILDDGWNVYSVKFDNGSLVESTATSEDSGRSMSIALLYLDEFAHVDPSIADEFWTSISPTLSTGGDCIITSTPNGDTNLYAQLWRGAEVEANSFKPTWVKWDQPPGRDEEFKKQQIGKLGERKWLQEYECHFLSSDALLIDSMVLINEGKRLENIHPLQTIHDVEFYKGIQPGKTYLIGIDPSTGSGEDFSVITGFNFPEMEQVFQFRSNSMSSPFLYKILKNIVLYLGKHNAGEVYFTIENNGVGEGILSLYEADEKPMLNAELVSEEGAKRRGMTTTNKSKMRSCVNFKDMFERIKKDNNDELVTRSMTINSMILLKELKTFARKGTSYSAQIGSTDDCISAILVILRMLEEMSLYDQEAYNKLHQFDDGIWDENGGQDAYNEHNPDHQPLPVVV